MQHRAHPGQRRRPHRKSIPRPTVVDGSRIIELAPPVARDLPEKLDFDRVLALDGTTYRQQHHRRTVRVELGDGAYFVKVHGRTSWREILKNALRLRWPVLTARNEREVIERLHELGVPSPDVVGYGCRGIAPAGLESFLITTALDTTVPLDELTPHLRTLPTAARRRANRALVREVATIARTLHRAGINHRDFYLCHLLVPTRDWAGWDGRGPLDVHVIDLHRAQRRRWIPSRWIVKDLAGLLFSSFDAGLEERDYCRFLVTYFGTPWREIRRRHRTLVHRVIERAIRQYQAQHGRTPRLPVGLASFV